MALSTAFHIDDSTPQVQYYPPPAHDHTPDPTVRWTPYFDLSGFSSESGQPGYGTGYHMTSSEGATLSFEFHGTGVQLLGRAIRANYSVLLDGATLPVDQDASDVLAEATGLPHHTHRVTLILHKNSSVSSVAFDKAVITTDSVPELSQRPPPPSNGRDVQRVKFVGDWAQRNVPSLIDAPIYHYSHTAGDRTVVAFAGTDFFLTGASGPSAGAYSVILDKNITTNLSATSSFTNPDALLYYVAGLDATVSHELEIINVNGSPMYLKANGLSSVPSVTRTPWSARQVTNDNSPTTQTNTGYSAGTIAALVLGGILIFIIVTSSFFYFAVYRPRQRRKAQDRRSFVNEPKSGLFEQPPLFRDSSSRRRGFERWRHDVEFGLGLGALANLGLAFRHSGEERRSRRSTTPSTDGDDYAEDVPLSSKSESSSTRSSERDRRKIAKGKMRAFTPSWRNSRSTGRHSGRTRSLSSPPGGSDLSQHGAESVYFAPIYKGRVVEATPYIVPSASSSSHPFSGQLHPPAPLNIPTVSIQSPTEAGSSPHSNRSQSRRAPGSDHGPSPLTSVTSSALTGLKPPREASGDDGSVKDADFLASRMNVSATTQVALRSLSPRTSEVMSRNLYVLPVPSPPDNRPSPARYSKDLPRLPSPGPFQPFTHVYETVSHSRSANSSSEVLDLGEMSRKRTPTSQTGSGEEQGSDNKEQDKGGGSKRTSGLSVRFLEQVDERKGDKGKGKPSSDGRSDRERSGLLKPFAKSRHLDQAPSSFLDLDSSSSGGSSRSPSNGSSLLSHSRRMREQSRWSNTTASQSASGHPLHSRWSSTVASLSPNAVDHSQASSQRVQEIPLPESTLLDVEVDSSNGNPFPYPVSLPPSPHHPEHILQMQQAQASGAPGLGLGLHAPADNGLSTYISPAVPTSPTDSLPMTVSEIQFRHNSISEEGYSHRPSHPRLPPLSSEESSGFRNTPAHTPQVPFIVHRVLGGQSSAPGSPLTPMAGSPKIPPK